jgi:hypothetical protein
MPGPTDKHLAFEWENVIADETMFKCRFMEEENAGKWFALRDQLVVAISQMWKSSS